MKVLDTALADVKLIELTAFEDERGYFLESFQAQRYAALLGLTDPGVAFVQDNYSHSKRGVLRGMHFQRKHPQGKLIRVLQGGIFDVAVDVRTGSATFGRWQGIRLSQHKHQQLWVPPGFAHGFVVLSSQATVEYKCTDYYHPEDEVCLRWDDASVAIDWPIAAPLLSAKDQKGLALHELPT